MSRSKSDKHIRVVVGILRKNSKILVAQRPLNKPYGGYWEFPGGKIESNERPADALKRELKEELAIEVIQFMPWFEHLHVYPDKIVILDIWLVEAYKEEIKANEGQNLKWVSFADMLELELLEGNKPILSRIKDLLEV